VTTMDDTGIALFVYKRPEHTRRVLGGLRRNDVDELYVFADGPKDGDDVDRIQAVREFVHSIDWCETHVIERDTNWGLADNTIDGINRVFEDHDRIIVLEDDDVPTPDFVDFMHQCFEEYESDDHVMSVTGYCPPLSLPEDYPYDVFFTYRDTTWGWGTWKDAWDRYERKPEEMRRQLADDPGEVRSELRKAGHDLFPILEAQLAGETDSWSVWWALAIIEYGGICVNPVESRIRNIGHDGSGVHCNDTDKYDVDVRTDRTEADLEFPPGTDFDPDLNERYNAFHRPDRWTRTKKHVGQTLERVGLLKYVR
jgi:hypothetical protein